MHLYKLFYRQVVGWLKKPPRITSGFECSSFKCSEAKKMSCSKSILGELEQVFRHFDADGDGKISVSELGGVINSLAGNCYEFTSHEELEMVVREVDSDGDGFLHLQEFLEFMKSEGGGVGSLQELREAFLIFDGDRNGYISAEELRSVLGRMGDERSHEECVKMIRGADQDGDGYVDFEEFRMMMLSSSI